MVALLLLESMLDEQVSFVRSRAFAVLPRFLEQRGEDLLLTHLEDDLGLLGAIETTQVLR